MSRRIPLHAFRHRAAERGMALLAVLWITILLAVIAASFASSTRTEGRLARNQLEIAKAEALADAGVFRAAISMLDPEPDRRWEADGRPYRFRLGDGTVTVRIEDEDAKVDLFSAPPELVQGLIESVTDLDSDAAASLAARIADYQDDDSELRPGGAEDPDYDAAGRPYGAKDARMRDTSELLRVLGVTPEVFAQLEPHVTVFSGSDGIDPAIAARPVLEAVPGLPPEAVEDLLGMGPDDDFFDVVDAGVEDDPTLYFMFSRQLVFTIRSTGQTAGGARFDREALIELTGDGSAPPFRVFGWRRGSRDNRPAVAADS